MKRTRKIEHPIAAARRLGEQFHAWQGAGLRKAVGVLTRRNPARFKVGDTVRDTFHGWTTKVLRVDDGLYLCEVPAAHWTSTVTRVSSRPGMLDGYMAWPTHLRAVAKNPTGARRPNPRPAQNPQPEYDAAFQAGYKAGAAAYRRDPTVSAVNAKAAYRKVWSKYGSDWVTGYCAAIDAARAPKRNPEAVAIASGLTVNPRRAPTVARTPRRNPAAVSKPGKHGTLYLFNVVVAKGARVGAPYDHDHIRLYAYSDEHAVNRVWDEERAHSEDRIDSVTRVR